MERVVKKYKITFNIEVPGELPSGTKYDLLDAVQDELPRSMSRTPVDVDEIYVTCESMSEVQENEEVYQ